MNKDSKLPLNNYVGCLLGGAIGDALGAPIEFMSINEIKIIMASKELQTM